MNKYQIGRHASNQLVVREALSHPEAMEMIPTFAVAIKLLDAINKKVDAIALEQSKDISGATTETNNCKTDVIEWTQEVAGAIHSYAASIKDVHLLSQSDIKSSDVEHQNKFDLQNTAKKILALAKLVPDNKLREQGIKPEDVAVFTKAIELYDEVKSSTREATIERASYTEQLAQLFVESGELLKNTLDKLSTQYRRKHPVFYAKYNAARIMSVSSSRKKNDKDAETSQQ